MARLVINEEVLNPGTFIPRQIFAFGSIVLHADPTGHLGRVGSFAPDLEVRFGNLEFFVDSRGDLSLTGLEVSPVTPEDSEALFSDPSFGPAHGIYPGEAPPLSPDLVIVPDVQTSVLAEHSPCADALKVHSGSSGQSDSIELSILNEALDRISSMKITDDPTPICAQIGLKTGQDEFFVPPTTHLTATVEDLTDVLDYASEEADYMDKEDHALTPINARRWTATSI